MLCVHASQFIPSSTLGSREKQIPSETDQQSAKHQYMVVVGLVVDDMVVDGHVGVGPLYGIGVKRESRWLPLSWSLLS